jgi:hypothetical protein
VTGAILKSTGTKAGIVDIFVLHAGHLYGIEVKTPHGRLSPVQRNMQVRLTAAGATVATAYGLDAALAQLERWHLLRGATQMRAA